MGDELTIGTLLDTDADAKVRAGRMNRHTFWCGQSGSGKTYALGVLLEQVLIETALPVVVLDPNSDFTRLGETRADAPPEVASTLRERDVRVFRPGQNLKARMLDMPVRSQAAILNLDPVLDAEEYNTMLDVATVGVRDIGADHLVPHLRSSDLAIRHRLALRLENLGVADWDLWAWGGRSITDDIDETPDATVIDLAGFATQTEFRAAALAVLDHLWLTRERRIGRLIVIDEAHNLCPPDPVGPIETLLTERIMQIAAEGRKYGLWLLLSTQRPSKIHPNVISQCDNLALLRMSSPRDLADIADVFGYAPTSLIEQSTSFRQGQALFAGGFIDRPSLVQMGARATHEGGVDVPVPLR